uniref:Uncharacterized protein n=1 Tax=Myoviridae sp. ctbEa13 TaxID=2825136 RepID=A0A8S5VBH8_9CAUD|nr:MAG TPA: hypothetical protein [Myoviridae sp. ctbEa13]
MNQSGVSDQQMLISRYHVLNNVDISSNLTL